MTIGRLNVFGRTGFVLGLAIVAGAPGARAAGLDDRAIFEIYDQVNGFDIETATLGAVKGQSEDVRALAAMVLRDHSMVRQMARDLAQRLGVAYAVPAQNAAAQGHAQALAALRGKQGAAFDRAYVAHEIAFHQGAIKAVKEALLPSVTNPDLKALIAAALPGFEQHLSHTLDTARRLGLQ